MFGVAFTAGRLHVDYDIGLRQGAVTHHLQRQL